MYGILLDPALPGGRPPANAAGWPHGLRMDHAAHIAGLTRLATAIGPA